MAYKYKNRDTLLTAFLNGRIDHDEYLRQLRDLVRKG